MLGQPLSLVLPEVLGFRLTGELPPGATATDLVLTVTQMLRRHGVVGKFVEFHGPGVARTSVADRVTIANMSPEFGSTCAVFPIDGETLRYLRFTGRNAEHVALVEAYAKTQGLWHEPDVRLDYSEQLELDLATVVPSLAGPHRPQDRVAPDGGEDGFPRRDARHGPTRAAAIVGRRSLRGVIPGQRRPSNRPLRPTRPQRTRSCPFVWPQPGSAVVGSGRHTQCRSAARRTTASTPRRCRRDCRDHLLHEHLKPPGHGRRGTPCPQRRPARPDPPPLGENHSVSGVQGGCGLPSAKPV
jgi:hypothetical protein